MDDLPPEAIAALRRGRLIEAIKIVHDSTGMDLQSAKDAVERYAAWMGDPGRRSPDVAAQDRGFASMPSTALTALAQGDKIEAVRLTREATGLSLAAAKRLVDNHEHPPVGAFGHLPSEIPRRPMVDEPGRVPAGGYNWLPVTVILLAMLMVWLLFGKEL
ncbi:MULTISPECIES: hypothetical protein [Variovorax]|jgi:ribosomal protein L7/L12|uniref:hypothetical protein n=1 Tax=Variovorax TaxID=34072 RepID=UPI00086D0D66|nr:MULTISPECIES: hypothetical protein [Variovorax]MBN8753099.1 hypothetical protein [Variovorax sp.]ODU11619.1 MAG: ribosomal protein L7/L12 [Variovorax sp. SCN 67-85]ODV15016.1 MAG: ribosomal protein L7/L12 [Variovorax sp. SCN 67-20]OJZ05264.1 MAG: ribosomal protein L7/L12 [Variovorax sp. 67-131]UKI05302.1 hypothetical protein L3V85_20965 [Variovorax paradoxus]